MSHIVSIKTLVRNPAAIAAACQRLNLTAPVQGTAKLYSGETTGLLVHLPGWQYPVVIDTASQITVLYNGSSTIARRLIDIDIWRPGADPVLDRAGLCGCRSDRLRAGGQPGPPVVADAAATGR